MSTCCSLRFSAIATGAGRGSEHDAELAGGQVSRRRPAVSPDIGDDRLAAIGHDLEVVLLVQSHSV